MINRLQEHAFEQAEFRIPDVLLTPRVPLRVYNPQTRRLLNFRDKDAVEILVGNRKLRPLGSPPKGAPLWFATSTNWVLDQGQPLPAIACIKRKSSEFRASARIQHLRDGRLIDVGDGQEKLLKNSRLPLDKSGHGDLPISVQLTNGHTLAV